MAACDKVCAGATAHTTRCGERRGWLARGADALAAIRRAALRLLLLLLLSPNRMHASMYTRTPMYTHDAASHGQRRGSGSSGEGHDVGGACAAKSAHADMEARLQQEGLDTDDSESVILGPNDPRRLAVRAGSFVTPEIITMFTEVAGGKRACAEAAVSRRAWGLLHEWVGPGLLESIAALAAHTRVLEEKRNSGTDAGPERRYWAFLLSHYHQTINEFCDAHGINKGESHIRIVDKVPVDIDGEDLVDVYVAQLPPWPADTLEYGDYLLNVLMANKQMIMWDVLLTSQDVPDFLGN